MDGIPLLNGKYRAYTDVNNVSCQFFHLFPRTQVWGWICHEFINVIGTEP
jgi:hypothetical protein